MKPKRCKWKNNNKSCLNTATSCHILSTKIIDNVGQVVSNNMYTNEELENIKGLAQWKNGRILEHWCDRQKTCLPPS